jgi:hypothetical protein
MGEASIWEPRIIAEVSADTKRVAERLTATAGQVLFELTSFSYALNTGALQVFRQGPTLTDVGCRALIPNIEYVEQTSTSFSLLTAAVAGEQILVVGYIGIEGTVDPRDTDIYVTNYQAIRDYTGVEITLYAQGTATLGDNGQAFFQYLSGAAPGTYVDDNLSTLVPTGGDGSAGWVRVPYTPAAYFPNVDGAVSATDEELSILAGVTATKDELNVLDGISSNVGELNILDGVTANKDEINVLDGVVAGTVTALKAIVAGASKIIDTLTITLIGAASVLADGVTATTQAVGDNSTKVATTAYVHANNTEDYILLEDQKASGTDGGGITTSWATRDINTEVSDVGENAVVAASLITLQPGTYRFNISAPAYFCYEHQIRLYNITDAVVERYGTSANTSAAAGYAVTRSECKGRFTIGAATQFKIEHIATNARATDGLGKAGSFGGTEIYAQAEFWKEN